MASARAACVGYPVTSCALRSVACAARHVSQHAKGGSADCIHLLGKLTAYN